MADKTSSTHSLHTEGDMNSPEYLSWRRLHLSKSKLSNVAEMASFMAGFAVVATVELQINEEDASPTLLTCFVVTTALLVGTSMIAIMIATCILPHIEAVAKMSLISEVKQSPHDKMIRLIDIAWVLANTASLFLFTLDVILMCWIKFTWFSKTASICATAIMGPVLLIILIFGIVFYRKIIKHQYVISNLKYQELERMKEDIERQTSVIMHFSRTSTIRSSMNPSIKSVGGGSISSGSSGRSSAASSSISGSKISTQAKRGSIFIV